jgi:hypothetical protein
MAAAGMAPRPGRSGSHARQVQSDDPGQDQADRDELEGGHGIAEKGHGRDMPWLSFRNTANPVSNTPAVTSKTHAIAVTSPFVRVMSR